MSVLIGWHFLTQKFNTCSQANVNVESDSALSQLISISLFLEGEGGWELAEQ